MALASPSNLARAKANLDIAERALADFGGVGLGVSVLGPSALGCINDMRRACEEAKSYLAEHEAHVERLRKRGHI